MQAERAPSAAITSRHRAHRAHSGGLDGQAHPRHACCVIPCNPVAPAQVNPAASEFVGALPPDDVRGSIAAGSRRRASCARIPGAGRTHRRVRPPVKTLPTCQVTPCSRQASPRPRRSRISRVALGVADPPRTFPDPVGIVEDHHTNSAQGEIYGAGKSHWLPRQSPPPDGGRLPRSDQPSAHRRIGRGSCVHRHSPVTEASRAFMS